MNDDFKAGNASQWESPAFRGQPEQSQILMHENLLSPEEPSTQPRMNSHHRLWLFEKPNNSTPLRRFQDLTPRCLW